VVLILIRLILNLIIMLNDDQSREYNRAKKLKEFFIIPANTTILNSFAPFKDRVTIFYGNFGLFDSYVPKKDASGKPITELKDALKREQAQLWAPILSLTHGYAIVTHNTVLAGAVNYTEEELYGMKDSDVLGFATHLNTDIFTVAFLADAVFATYNVTDTMVTAALAKSNEFNSKIGVASTVQHGASVASSDIDAVIGKIHEDINLLDLLVVNFASTQPDFVEGYNLNKHKDEIGVRHQGMQGVVRIGGVVTDKAVVSVVGTSKSAGTDLAGHYALIKVKQGLMQVKCEVPGKPPVEVTHRVIRGKISELNFDF
jgi:hypothetical protein